LVSILSSDFLLPLRLEQQLLLSLEPVAATLKCNDNPHDAVKRIRWLLDTPVLQYRQGKVKVRCTLEQIIKAKRGVDV